MKLFAAIPIPAGITLDIQSIAERIPIPDPVPPHRYHLTLRHFGEADPEDIGSRLATIRAAPVPVVLERLKPLEFEGTRYACLRAALTPELADLVQRMDAAFGPRDLPFRPHVTLGSGTVSRVLAYSIGFTAEEFLLYESAGGTYRPLRAYPLE